MCLYSVKPLRRSGSSKSKRVWRTSISNSSKRLLRVVSQAKSVQSCKHRYHENGFSAGTAGKLFILAPPILVVVIPETASYRMWLISYYRLRKFDAARIEEG